MQQAVTEAKPTKQQNKPTQEAWNHNDSNYRQEITGFHALESENFHTTIMKRNNSLITESNYCVNWTSKADISESVM